MLSSLQNAASKAVAAATDAVSEISLDSVKGKVTSTVTGTGNSISQTVTNVTERVKDRVSDPADAYDEALLDIITVATENNIPHTAYETLTDLVKALQTGNPYRS